MAAGDVAVSVTKTNAKECCVFDGVDDKVLCGTATENYATLSVAGWFKFDGIKTQYLFSSVGTGTDKFLLYSTGALITFYYNGGETSIAWGSVALNTWHHISAVYNGTTATIYLNGVAQTPVVVAALGSASRTIRIGVDPAAAVFFYGDMCDLKIWNRALSSAEITSSCAGCTPSGLLHHWKLRSNYQDSAGTNHGTNTGTAFSIQEDAVLNVVKTQRAATGATGTFLMTALSPGVLPGGATGAQIVNVAIDE